jgi:hypothetical protein
MFADALAPRAQADARAPSRAGPRKSANESPFCAEAAAWQSNSLRHIESTSSMSLGSQNDKSSAIHEN